MADTAIADFLKAEGFVSPASAAAARTALEEAGLTRPGKTRMADEKLDRARNALTQAVIRHCSRSGLRCRGLRRRPPIHGDR